MCKVIAVAMQKGGCAKTSVSLNLGIGLARAGKKVLLIDNDPQGNLTASLGYEEPDDMSQVPAPMTESHGSPKAESHREPGRQP